jgi:hypothetical protein
MIRRQIYLLRLNTGKSNVVFHLFQVIYLNFRGDDVKFISTVNETDKKKKHFPVDACPNANRYSIIHSCWSCNKPGKSLLKCSVCRKARYCGEPCQWEDWGRHREWCRRSEKKLKEKRNQQKNIDPLAEMKTVEGDEVD